MPKIIGLLQIIVLFCVCSLCWAADEQKAKDNDCQEGCPTSEVKGAPGGDVEEKTKDASNAAKKVAMDTAKEAAKKSENKEKEEKEEKEEKAKEEEPLETETKAAIKRTDEAFGEIANTNEEDDEDISTEDDVIEEKDKNDNEKEKKKETNNFQQMQMPQMPMMPQGPSDFTIIQGFN